MLSALTTHTCRKSCDQQNLFLGRMRSSELVSLCDFTHRPSQWPHALLITQFRVRGHPPQAGDMASPQVDHSLSADAKEPCWNYHRVKCTTQGGSGMSPAVGGPKVWPCCHINTHLTHQGSLTFLMSDRISSTDIHFQSTDSPRTWNNAEPRTNECLIVHGSGCS